MFWKVILFALGLIAVTIAAILLAALFITTVNVIEDLLGKK